MLKAGRNTSPDLNNKEAEAHRSRQVGKGKLSVIRVTAYLKNRPLVLAIRLTENCEPTNHVCQRRIFPSSPISCTDVCEFREASQF